MAEESTRHGGGFVPRSVNAVLARAVRMHPDTVAVETDDDQLTYGQLHDAVLRLAADSRPEASDRETASPHASATGPRSWWRSTPRSASVSS